MIPISEQREKRATRLGSLLMTISMLALLSLPILEHTHDHPGDQHLTIDCGICLQLSAADSLPAAPSSYDLAVSFWQFTAHYSNPTSDSPIGRQLARAPPLS